MTAMGCGVVIPGYNIVMMETPVTQEMYEEVMGTNPSGSKHRIEPVTNVSWVDAVRFCNRLSVRRGLQRAYKLSEPETDSMPEWTLVKEANGYRLPSKDEWLYAERGGQNYLYADLDNPYDVAWFRGNSRGRVKLVGQKEPNGYGLYDMLGNVWEWVSDKALNPKTNEEQHQLLGGSCVSSVKELQQIMLQSEGYTDPRAGFRLIRAHVEGSQQ